MAAGKPSGSILKDVYLLLNFTVCQSSLLKITGSLKAQGYIYKKIDSYSCAGQSLTMWM